MCVCAPLRVFYIIQMRLFVFIFILNTLLFSYARAQEKPCNIQLNGTVIDFHNGKKLDFASIYLVEKTANKLSSEHGKFNFENLCGGTYTLHVSHIGCEPKTFTINLNKDTSIVLLMEHSETELTEIVVQEQKEKQSTTSDIVQLPTKALEKLRGLTLGETLKTISGVSTLNTGTNISKPIIHGLQGVRILILNNSIRQESQQWGNEHAPEIDPFLAQKISIVKGAEAVRYGSDAIGGVILVEPNLLPNTSGISGELNYVLHSNNAEQSVSGLLQGNHRKIPALAWRVQGTYRRGGNARTANYWLKNTGVEEGNFSATLGWNKSNYGIEIFYSRFQTDLGILSASHFGNIADLENAITRGKPNDNATFSFNIGIPRQAITHNLLKTSARLNTKNIGELKLQFAFQHNLRREYDKQRAYNNSNTLNAIPGAEFAIQTITTDLVWSHKTIKRFSGKVGASFMTQTNNQKYSTIIPPFWNFNGSLFAIEQWQYKKLKLEAGFRLDYRWQQAYLQKEKPSFNYFIPSGNIGLQYSFSPQVKWNVNIGSAWRAPNMVEMFADGVHHGAASYDKGNRNLKPEIAFNLSTSLEANWRWFQVHFHFYQNFINHFIYSKPSLQNIETIRGTFPIFEYTQANASLTGSDIDIIIKPFMGLEFPNKISLLRAWNSTANEGLILMPPQRFEHGIRYTFSPSTKITNLYFGLNVLYEMRQYLAPPNQDITPPPPAYWLLNAEAGFEIETKMPQPISINLSGKNLLNKAYRNYLNRFRYFCEEQGADVTLRLKVPFYFSPKK
ncbi:MAG: hypothetical protein BGO32_09595 [Bacteroidetes bacterium 37-13]|nr:MAG: hypothetical protein BGO32_09595 [Bacteroidetes bacterium 37-13]